VVDSKIKVLIVDDSAVARQSISMILSGERDIKITGTAPDPFYAVEKIAIEVPDVIILDIEMPRMDGLTFLRKIMEQHPIPVIICSNPADKDSEPVMNALRYGAVDIILKPEPGRRQFLEESKIRIADAVRAAASMKRRKLKPGAEFSVITC